MTDKDKIAHLKSALERLATHDGFVEFGRVAHPEEVTRATFAQAILDDHTIKSATEKAIYEGNF
jgi:hypothetical protein